MPEETPKGWRIAIISMVPPVAVPLIEHLRELGHEPVAWLVAAPQERRRAAVPPWGEITDSMAPSGVSLLFARDKEAVAPLLRGLEPDLVFCWGFRWKLPQEALDVPRLGRSTTTRRCCPATAGRFRWPGRSARATARSGMTWHRMDAELDTGAILAQKTIPIEDDWTPRSRRWARRCSRARSSSCRMSSSGSRPAIPAMCSRPRASPGPASSRRTTRPSTGRSPPGRSTTRCAPGTSRSACRRSTGPIAELDGERVKLLRTSLTDPGDGVRAVECGDGTLWILESEPAS